MILTAFDSPIAHLLTWGSRRIKRIVRSTLAAETLALQDALDAAHFIVDVIRFLTGVKIPIIAFTDSKQLFTAIYSQKTVEKTFQS